MPPCCIFVTGSCGGGECSLFWMWMGSSSGIQGMCPWKYFRLLILLQGWSRWSRYRSSTSSLILRWEFISDRSGWWRGSLCMVHKESRGGWIWIHSRLLLTQLQRCEWDVEMVDMSCFVAILMELIRLIVVAAWWFGRDQKTMMLEVDDRTVRCWKY